MKVKFFSDSKEEFEKPCFVTEEGRSKQTVMICNYLLKSMRRENESLKSRIYFWKTYGRQVKSVLTKMRMADINSFQKKFKAGEYVSHNYDLLS